MIGLWVVCALEYLHARPDRGTAARQVFPSLAEDPACIKARQMKRSALNAALASQRASAAVATTDRFPKRLRTDGRDVVELFVSGPGESRPARRPRVTLHTNDEMPRSVCRV